MANNLFGVDLGTANIKMLSKGENKVLIERNTIAIKNKTELYAFGDDAYAMYEKAPAIIKVSFPVVNGVIADFNNMQRLAEVFLDKHAKVHAKNCEFIVAVPTDITEVEKRSFYELFFKSKMRPKSVMLCEKPIAACVGLGLDVNEPTGVMVVDMGADTTEISLLSLGGLVLSDLLHIGGNNLDEAIITHIKRKFSLVIGQKTAQALKMELASANGGNYGTQVVVGRDVISGLPVEMEISSQDVNEAITEQLNAICTSIKMILEKTPPELAKDVIHSGIYLAGGASKLHDIDKLVSQVTNISVNLCDEPDLCVVRGLNTIVSEKKYSSLAYSLKKRVYN